MAKYNFFKKTMTTKPEITVDDIAEIAVFNRRKEFLSIYERLRLDVSGNESREKTYEKSEVEWISKYGHKAYKNFDSFIKLYYQEYRNNKENKKSASQLSLF